MVGIVKRSLLIIAMLASAAWCEAKVYPNRWVFVSSSLRSEAEVGRIEQIVQTASARGLNGMVLSAGLDRLDKQREDYLARLSRIKAFCAERNVEIIPNIFSVGYGGSVLAYDRNLAAGIPVVGTPFLVRDGRACFDPEMSVEMDNPGFEQHEGDRVAGYRFHDRPGEVSFVDTDIFHSGGSSLRFESFGRYEHGHGRVMQEVKVQPHRCYRLSCWVRTEALQPATAFRVQVLSPEGRSLAPYDPRMPSTGHWRRIVMGFNSLEHETVRIYAGVWGGREGRFWIDDFALEEVGLLNVLRRRGTPLVVQSEGSSQVYEEGRDFAYVTDDRLNFRFDHDGPEIELLPDSRIAEGQRLRVSYYHGIAINNGQVTVCMSEPNLYEIWRNAAQLLHERLGCSKYLLSMDEIRAGGSCQACRQRNLSMAQILGECITEQVRILRSVNLAAQVFIWSDMLDPNHNAHGDYYLVEGDFTGSWRYVPKDLVIVCWYYDKRHESLPFFASHGFRTLAGAYYDGDTLDNPRGWLEALDATPNAIGIMYTTWQNKYDLLGPFGDLVYNR